eukprot:scaffold134_cov94-Amphora_coffeaeformis.AAC.10
MYGSRGVIQACTATKPCLHHKSVKDNNMTRHTPIVQRGFAGRDANGPPFRLALLLEAEVEEEVVTGNRGGGECLRRALDDDDDIMSFHHLGIVPYNTCGSFRKEPPKTRERASHLT